MRRISAHLPAVIGFDLRWAFLSLLAVLSSLIGITPAHAAIRPAPGDLHTSRDGMIRQAVARVLTQARQRADSALPLHKVKAGESLSSIAVTACHGKANMWTGIYAASRSRHLTGVNANIITIGQLVAIDCIFLPRELRYAIPPPHPAYQTTAAIRSSGRAPYHVYHRYRSWRHYRAYSSATYHGSSGYERCVIARESGGNSQVWNASGHWGSYQFSRSTWEAYGGSASSFGNASAAEQHRIFSNAMATPGGASNWSPYDHCL